LAREARVGVDVAVGVVAVLSPSVSWATNLNSARSLLLRNGGPIAGYGQNVKKAQGILERAKKRRRWVHLVSGPKVFRFFETICAPEDYQDVVVDGHVYALAVGERITLSNVPAITEKRRDAIARAFKALAGEFGVLPHQLQATAWLTWRRLHGLENN
jgi:hypothetical protein